MDGEELQIRSADLFQTTLDANRDADLILNSGLSFAGWHVAEKLNKPAIAAYLWPAIPSRYIPSTMGYQLPEWMPFKGALNYGSTKFSNQTFFNLFRSSVNQCRRDILNLAPLSAGHYWRLDSPKNSIPFVYGYSPIVLPKPAIFFPSSLPNSGKSANNVAVVTSPTPGALLRMALGSCHSLCSFMNCLICSSTVFFSNCARR